jgi:hypothetical protein
MLEKKRSLATPDRSPSRLRSNLVKEFSDSGARAEESARGTMRLASKQEES